MKIQRVTIDAFGKLVDREFDFDSGLNIIFGANEAGKSTLQEAILTLLYGPYSTVKKSRGEESEILERNIPWNDYGRFGGQIVYSLSGGRSFTIFRDLQRQDSKIIETESGRDVSNQFQRGHHGYLGVGDKHWGMSRKVFANTCFIRQSSFNIENPQIAGEIAMALADTATSDQTAEKATNALQAALSEIGTDQAWTKPYRQTQDQLEVLLAEYKETVACLDELSRDIAVQQDLLIRQEELSSKAIFLEHMQAVEQCKQLETRLCQVRELHNALEETRDKLREMERYRSFPVDLYDDVLAANQDMARLQEEKDSLARRVDEGASRLRELEEQEDALQKEAARLESFRTFAAEMRTTISRQQADRQEARVRAAEAGQACDAAAKTLGQAEEKVVASQYPLPAAEMSALLKQWRDSASAYRSAESTLSSAGRAKQSTGLTDEEFATLESTVGDLGPDRLAQFSTEAAHSRGSATDTRTPLLITGAIILAVLVGSALVGQALIGLALDAVIGIGAVVWSTAAGRAGKRDGTNESELGSELRRRGATDFGDLTAKWTRYNQARQIFDAFRAAQGQVATTGWRLQAASAEIRNVMSMPADMAITENHISGIETGLQQLAYMQSQLGVHRDQLEHAKEKASEVSAALTLAESRLRESLAGCGFDLASVDESLEAFEYGCKQHERLKVIDLGLANLRNELAPFEQISRQLSSTCTGLTAAETLLSSLLSGAGIIPGDLSTATKEFFDSCKQRRAADGLAERQGLLQEQLAQTAGSQPLDELASLHARTQAQIRVAEAAHPELGGAVWDSSSQSLQEELQTVRSDLNQVASDLGQVKGRLDKGLGNHRQLPEIEEEIAQKKLDLADMEMERAALQLAINSINEAAEQTRREFIPRLNLEVAGMMSEVTNGRYRDVRIDPAQFSPTLLTQERSVPIQSSNLSRGTCDQVLIAIRICLAQLMSANKEPLPILLDDPLVNFDSKRQARALEYLTRLTGHGFQVILFTQLDGVRDWFRSELAGQHHHRLLELPGPQ